MAGYIGSKASVVSSGAERKKVFSITTTTSSLTGLSYTPNQVHVFHNGVRLVDGTDYTATNGTSITLTTAAENGDQVVVISYATFQTSDTVSASAGGTFSNAVAVNGNLTVDTNTLFVDAASNNVGIGTSSPATKFSVTGGYISQVNAGVSTYLGEDGSGGSLVGTVSNHYFRFITNDTERMRIDAGGSVLIGRSTPADLHNTWNHLIIGEKGAIISENGAGGIPGVSVADNAYIDADTGAYAYITTNEASILTQEAGILTFSNAASGTAGNALTWSERLRIDAAGRVTMPYQPAFNAFYSVNGSFNLNSSAVWPHDSLRFDRGNNFNTSLYRFTAPVAGVYFFEFQTIQINALNNLAVGFRINGGVADGSRQHMSNYGSGWQQISTSSAFSLNAGDYVDVANIGPTSTFHGGSWQNFSGYLIG